MKKKTTQQETMRLDSGTLYRKTSGGTWYYRFQINGKRKAISLKLRDKDKALEAAKKLVLITQSDNAEVIAAHVKVFRKIEKKQTPLSLEKAWELYSKHPERCNPATVHEQFAIHRIYDEFCRFVGMIDFSEVTPALAEDYARHLKASGISVATHNRKIKRVRKIFEVLKFRTPIYHSYALLHLMNEYIAITLSVSYNHPPGIGNKSARFLILHPGASWTAGSTVRGTGPPEARRI